MSNPTYTSRLAERLGGDALAELALDLRWSFNHAADAIWEQLDPELWALTHNPWFVLQTVSRDRLKKATEDPGFRRLVDQLVQESRRSRAAPTWFPGAHPHAPFSTVAYFSMEFMLSEALPIYSGGLGNVAGDQLKAASNLGVPVVGVGLLYQQGYFRQELDERGRQRELYPFNDPGQLPIRPVRLPSGEWLRLSIAWPGSTLRVRAWRAQVGRAVLYLLDTNDPANTPAHRGITSELYGGGADLRLEQEIVLGLGGWRLLEAVGQRPQVCHLNEGHSAFVVLDRARAFMAAHRLPFDAALTITRAGNVFTTHTPVDAGFDRFAPDQLARYFTEYAERELGVSFEHLLALGRRDPLDRGEPFNMAYLGVRGSGAVNGVSRLHGAVSRRIFQPLFPRWPEGEVPVAHVTNGVHAATWDSAEADRVWEAACGKDRWRWAMPDVERDMRCVGDEDLWQLREKGRQALVRYVREQLARQRAAAGASAADIAGAAAAFDPAVLTVGFARRFATYKRPNMLLHDPDRLARIVADRRRPVQLLVAGKAHPEDGAGRALIEAWVAFTRRPDVFDRVVFLTDYDMLMAERLVQGIDLWINTPRRPWEACGTSGMKVLVNGGLNLSELDGWWAEAYAPDVGWAIGDGRDRGEDPAWDAAEADALYTVLERDVVPAFYTRDARGLPAGWVARMRESMARLTPMFSANRSVREYTDDYYLPAAAAYAARVADGGRMGAAVEAWRRAIAAAWGTAAFRDLDVRTDGDQHLFSVQIDLGRLEPDDVRVELYAESAGGNPPVRQVMRRGPRGTASGNLFRYDGAAAASRPASDYTPRLIPYHAAARVPLEAPHVLWYEGRR